MALADDLTGLAGAVSAVGYALAPHRRRAIPPRRCNTSGGGEGARLLRRGLASDRYLDRRQRGACDAVRGRCDAGIGGTRAYNVGAGGAALDLHLIEAKKVAIHFIMVSTHDITFDAFFTSGGLKDTVERHSKITILKVICRQIQNIFRKCEGRPSHRFVAEQPIADESNKRCSIVLFL